VRRLVPGKVKEAHVDMGCRGHGHEGTETIHVDRHRRGRLARTRWKRMKHRAAAVEPATGHCKNEHRMERNRLWGEMGDAINALLSSAAMNFQKLPALFGHFILRLVLGLSPHLSTPYPRLTA
jgi:IS5 family transposase